MHRTPRLLIITRNLPPLIGGMERLNWHIAQELSNYAEVKVIGPRGSAALAPPRVTLHEARTSKLSSFLVRGLFSGIVIARSWRPAVVLAGSGLTAPLVVLAAKLSGAKSAVYTHGLDLVVKHPVYRMVWLRFIARADIVLVNSSATRELAVQAGIDPHRIRLVHPGVALPMNTTAENESFRQQYHLGDSKLLISVGRLTQRKGIREFVRGVLPKVVARFPNCRFVVVGGSPANALAAPAQSVESIREAAAEAGVAESVVFVGSVSDQELSAAFRSADVHVFPVREVPGDPEGFGMVAIEAAAHGLATVAYRTGGVPDAVSDGRSGRLVDPGDEGDFARAVIELLDQPLEPEATVAFARGFAWDCVGKRLARALNLGVSQDVLTGASHPPN